LGYSAIEREMMTVQVGDKIVLAEFEGRPDLFHRSPLPELDGHYCQQA
jgi:hypothetical protein